MPDATPIPCHRDLPEREAPCGCCQCAELRAELAGLLHLRAHLGTDQAPGWAFTDEHTPDATPCSTDTAGPGSTRPNGSGPGTPSATRSSRTPAPSATSPGGAPTLRSTNDAT